MSRHFSTTLYIEVDVIVNENPVLRCEIPFECSTIIDNEFDPTLTESSDTVLLDPSFVVPHWVNSDMIDYAEEAATKTWEREYETYEN